MMPARCIYPQYAFEALHHFREIIHQSAKCYVFLDYDGTVSPIAPTPEEAVMPPETLTLLKEIARNPKVTMAIVSGRSLAFLKRSIGIETLIYAGNHGLEIESPKLQFVHPQTYGTRPVLKEICRELRECALEFPGALVEEKGLTASLHYRLVADDAREPLLGKALTTLKPFHSHVRVTEGKQVLEVRPRVNWHKGTAARWIMDAAGSDGSAMFIGDDVTDEDAFVTLRDEITVKVQPTAEEVTAARYFVRDTVEVQFLLGSLFV